MIQFVGNILGVEVLNRAFNRVEEYTSDLRPIWPDVAGEIYAITTEQFETEGASGASGRWEGLSPAYEKYKVIQFPGQPILQAEGHMVDSLTDPDALDAVYLLEPTVLTIGSKDPKARAHHLGLGNLPARPIYSFTERQRRRMQKAIQRGLVQFTRQAGFQVEEREAA